MSKLIKTYRDSIFGAVCNLNVHITFKILIIAIISFLVGGLIIIFFSTILFLIIYMLHRLFSNDFLGTFINILIFDNAVNFTIIGSFIVSVFSVIIVLSEYRSRINASYNSISIIVKIKKDFEICSSEYRASSKISKLKNDYEEISKYSMNDLLLEKFSDQFDNISNYLLRITSDNQNAFYRNSFISKLKDITDGNLDLFYIIKKDNKGKKAIEFKTKIKFKYKSKNIDYFYTFINKRLCVLTISKNAVRIFDMKYVFMMITNNSGNTNIKNLKLSAHISFHSRDHVYGSIEHFFKSSPENHYSIDILNFDNKVIYVPIYMSMNEIFVTINDAEIEYITKYSKNAVLSLSKTNYLNSSDVEYIMERKS